MLKLDTHDEALVEKAKTAIAKAIASAHSPVAVAKRITVFAVRKRNRGRAAAIKRYPFKGICEASNSHLDAEHAVLDELQPELGYSGLLRWVCHKANNSGKSSCGKC